mmetsp:Transcript_6759/g.20047  ORF Transcript_6759/g.20047 Transcript_6759/m.20047 type:complete len:686 (-) Transcript_6759:1082-3139(-)
MPPQETHPDHSHHHSPPQHQYQHQHRHRHRHQPLNINMPPISIRTDGGGGEGGGVPKPPSSSSWSAAISLRGGDHHRDHHDDDRFALSPRAMDRLMVSVDPDYYDDDDDSDDEVYSQYEIPYNDESDCDENDGECRSSRSIGSRCSSGGGGGGGARSVHSGGALSAGSISMAAQSSSQGSAGTGGSTGLLGVEDDALVEVDLHMTSSRRNSSHHHSTSVGRTTRGGRRERRRGGRKPKPSSGPSGGVGTTKQQQQRQQRRQSGGGGGSLFGVDEEAEVIRPEEEESSGLGDECGLHDNTLHGGLDEEGLCGGLDSARIAGEDSGNYGVAADGDGGGNCDADALLDDGALRFAPRGERPVAAQLQSLTQHERECFDELRRRWSAHRHHHHHRRHREGETDSNSFDLSDDMILRFGRCSPGLSGPFDVESAFKVMKSYDRRYLDLTVGDVEDHLRTRTFVICPGLRTREGYDVLCMRPSNYPAEFEFHHRVNNASSASAFSSSSSSSSSSSPSSVPAGSAASCATSQCGGETSTYAGSASVSSEPAVDGLVYAVQTLLASSEHNSSVGIAILADMTGWNYDSDFSAPYFHQLILMLQGRIPVRVRKFIVSNPPPWFRRAWTFLVRPVLREELREKVIICSGGEDEVGKYMTDDYKDYLPDDVHGGRANTGVLVEDFIRYRKHVEGVL